MHIYKGKQIVSYVFGFRAEPVSRFLQNLRNIADRRYLNVACLKNHICCFSNLSTTFKSCVRLWARQIVFIFNYVVLKFPSCSRW